MIYLTFNEQVSGVYKSQVVDTVKHLRTLSDKPVRLVAVVSVRGFFASRAHIKALLEDAIVIPMFPRAQNWPINVLSILPFLLFNRKQNIMGRGIFATLIASRLRAMGLANQVIYDGRGAYEAEWHEYKVFKNETLKHRFLGLEKKAIEAADLHLAVSKALVTYWRERFDYQRTSHTVIPCTVSSSFVNGTLMNEAERQSSRENLGLAAQDVVLAYAGSVAGWQSFDMLRGWLEKELSSAPHYKVLFLSKESPELVELQHDFSSQVKIMWLDHSEVFNTLQLADYGILVREQTVTNRVASPTKFAEYLSAGLSVIVSENLGDYSDFVEQHACGTIFDAATTLSLSRIEDAQRMAHRALALEYFTKSHFDAAYRQFIES